MSTMNDYSNYSYRNLLFALGDGFLILGGIVFGNFIRFGGRSGGFIYSDYLTVKAILIVAVIQITFYYLDLYELKRMRSKTKTGILLLEATGISSIILSVIYYVFPFLSFWRGTFLLSMSCILILSFSWRLFYFRILDSGMFKERVLIVGCGEVAKKICEEINQNGQGAFEIIGFVDENRERIGETLSADDSRGFQPDLFHLQRR